MLPPAWFDEGCPPEAEIERSHVLLADLRQASLMKLNLDLVGPMLSMLDVLLLLGVDNARLFAVRFSLLR